MYFIALGRNEPQVLSLLLVQEQNLCPEHQQPGSSAGELGTSSASRVRSWAPMAEIRVLLCAMLIPGECLRFSHLGRGLRSWVPQDGSTSCRSPGQGMERVKHSGVHPQVCSGAFFPFLCPKPQAGSSQDLLKLPVVSPRALWGGHWSRCSGFRDVSVSSRLLSPAETLPLIYYPTVTACPHSRTEIRG